MIGERVMGGEETEMTRVQTFERNQREKEVSSHGTRAEPTQRRVYSWETGKSARRKRETRRNRAASLPGEFDMKMRTRARRCALRPGKALAATADDHGEGDGQLALRRPESHQ